jgi:hypothetical protein
MCQVDKKGTYLLTHVVIAVAFIALGIFLEEDILPPTSEVKKAAKANVVQSFISLRTMYRSETSKPSAVTQQLIRVIEAAFRNDLDSASGFYERNTASQWLIDKANQLSLLLNRFEHGHALISSEILHATLPGGVKLPGARRVYLRTGATDIGLASVACGFYRVGALTDKLVYYTFTGLNWFPANIDAQEV